ncbi:MAG: sensor histidine kinase, partial [Pacificimonas sp.]
SDTGPGLKAEKPKFVDGAGVGLGNIRDRLAETYDGKASLTISDRPGGGVVARLDIPYQTEAKLVEREIA